MSHHIAFFLLSTFYFLLSTASMKVTPHKYFFNSDTGFLFQDQFYPTDMAAQKHPAQWLHDYVNLLADAGIDTLLLCAGGQKPGFSSKVQPSLPKYQRGDRDYFRGYFPPTNDTDFTPEMLEQRIDHLMKVTNRFVDLEEAGMNTIVEMAKACRNRGISPWASLRMNDGHGGNNWDHWWLNNPVQQNPKFRLSGKALNPKDGNHYGWQLSSYEHREVRDYYFTMVKELVEDFDIDGLELDWLRCAFCCEPEASQKTIDMMTDWHAEIRDLCRARSKKTGKPFYLGLRIPPNLGLVKSIGLDVKEMARRDLIDYISPGNYFQASWDIPYDTLRADLGDNVSILGGIEALPNWMDAGPEEWIVTFRWFKDSLPLMRGNAANKLAMGVDGLEYFNLFVLRNDPVYTELQKLTDLNALRGKPKHYTFSSMNCFYNSFSHFENSSQFPEIIEPDWRKAFRISMCAEPADKNLQLTIQVILERKEKQPDIGVSFNGSWPNFEATPTDDLLFPAGKYSKIHSTHQAFNYTFDVNLIKEGWNEMILYNETHEKATPEQRAANSAHVVAIELSVI